MAKHEVIIRENTGTTQEEAPYLPQYVKKTDLAFAALCTQVAAEAGLTDTQVRAIFEGAFAEFVAMEQDAPVRIHVDGMTIALTLYGSLPSSDAAFDPLKNSLEIVLQLEDDIKNALVNVTPTIVTDETSAKVRLTVVADEAVPRPYELIHGTHVFQVQGYNLVMTDVGAGVQLVNSAGAVFPCTVVEAVSKQVVRVKTATMLEAGDYKLYVKSRGGDAEGDLQSPFRRVKYMQTDPEPIVETPDHKCQVMSVTDNDGASEFDLSHEWKMSGKGFYAVTPPEGEWMIEDVSVTLNDTRCSFSYSPSASGTVCALTKNSGEPAAGTYENATLKVALSQGATTHEFEIPLAKVIVA